MMLVPSIQLLPKAQLAMCITINVGSLIEKEVQYVDSAQ